LALALVRHYGGVEGIDRGRAMDAVFFTIVAGFVGSRVLYVAFHWSEFADAPRTVLFSTGSFMGGLISAVAFAVYWYRRIGLPYLVGLDLLALAAACLTGVGRWGCFFSGCCWGTPSDLPWAVTFPDLARKLHDGLPAVPLHPTQLYLSLNSLLILAVLALVYRHKRFHGQILLTYLVLYGVTRALLENLRGDSRPAVWVGGLLSSSQLLSLIVAATAAICYVVMLRRHPASSAPA
jgi:phosphatidylglycerol:prolipoprotein diacylglycerol transferase